MAVLKDGLKISTKPSAEITDGLKSLAAIQSTLSNTSLDFSSVVSTLVEIGVTQGDVGNVLDNVKSNHQKWVDDLKTKLCRQLDQLGNTLSEMKLPVYNCTGPSTQQEIDDDFVKSGNSLLKPASTAVANLKGFIAAVKVSCGLANLEVDLSRASSLLSEGQTFVYSYTLLTILISPGWRIAAWESDGWFLDRLWLDYTYIISVYRL